MYKINCCILIQHTIIFYAEQKWHILVRVPPLKDIRYVWYMYLKVYNYIIGLQTYYFEISILPSVNNQYE